MKPLLFLAAHKNKQHNQCRPTNEEIIFKFNYYKNNSSVILNVKYAHTSADENVIYFKYMLQFCVNIITACAKRKDLNWLPVFYQSLAEINLSESV